MDIGWDVTYHICISFMLFIPVYVWLVQAHPNFDIVATVIVSTMPYNTLGGGRARQKFEAIYNQC